MFCGAIFFGFMSLFVLGVLFSGIAVALREGMAVPTEC